MLTLVNSNNYFGQHEFHIENDDLMTIKQLIDRTKWFKTPKIVLDESKLVIFCFTNYDKATVERLFENG